MQLRAGRILLDMLSIAMTDMPRSERVPSRKVTDHMIGEESFAVTRVPTAEFTIDRSEHVGANLFRVNGPLTLRGVTKPVTFDMTLWRYEPTALRATARLTIDRMQWGVAFRGSRLTNDLVDDDVQLELDITARQGAPYRTGRARVRARYSCCCDPQLCVHTRVRMIRRVSPRSLHAVPR